MADELVNKIRRMSEYLDEGAIAAALRIPVETVHDVLEGRVNLSRSESENQTVLQVQTNPVYRQRIVSVWRGRGGVGCTSVALHLAYVLEQMMSVLLVDLNAVAGGSDVGYYLRLPEYPNMESLSRGGPLSSAVIQAESGLWVLLPPLSGGIDEGAVSKMVVEARKDFDVVVFDLPNIDTDPVQTAVACSNALVMVTNGLPQEMTRVLSRKNQAQRETVLIANGCPRDRNVKKEYIKIIELPEDKELASRMEKGTFYKKGSPLTTGAEKLRDMLFGIRPQEEGGFRKVMSYFLGAGEKS